MRIVIIGAGVGGCASYLFLRKHLDTSTHTIHLYEAYPNPLTTSTVIGGGLGLAPNGLRTLSLLSDALPSRIAALGFEAPVAEFRTGPKDASLGTFNMGSKERYGWANLSVQRAAVHECVLEEAVKADEGKGGMVFGRRVAKLESVGLDGATKITFEDGSEEEADLVIGADGLRSKVRDYVVGEHVEPEYYGLCGIGGFVPLHFIEPYILHTSSPLVMTWGSTGFFGFSPVGTGRASLPSPSSPPQPKAMWWSIYASDTPPARTASTPLSIKAQLQRRFAGYEGAVPRIINALCTDEPGVSDVLVLPRYKLPNYLAKWHRADGGAVLVGDAAHVAPPESGQGVSFAVEDAAAFAMLLAHHLARRPDDEKDALRRAAGDYSALRKPRVETTITAAMKRIANKTEMSWFQRWLRDWIVWIMCRITPDSSNDRVFAYKVEEAVQEYLKARGA
ncbi:FAD/NAD(P)-binding domain-containing protein [Heliocybe sulcata]|uniref:FAD/NAD(P)-binding domain-containing protein n=1 Tax=Heliocybe sulcata TaxID=5364 RepID=A0A5C3NGK3_9AGAM|nr:FAD/NAD(P)-binding domain-containing protein [Heliocybe sulcata]